MSKDPNHQRALWLSGIAAVQRDDKAAALSHWQHLLPLLPPESTVYNAVADQIRGIGGEVAAAVTQADTSAAAIAPVIRIQVSIAAALQQRVAATDTVAVSPPVDLVCMGSSVSLATSLTGPINPPGNSTRTPVLFRNYGLNNDTGTNTTGVCVICVK